jgi:hypothetical protein
VGNYFERIPQFFAINLFNNDGHLVPTQVMVIGTPWKTPISNPVDIGGAVINTLKTGIYVEPWRINLSGYENLSYGLSGGKFYHRRWAGDSGSPALAPVANGEWALCGIISGNLWTYDIINSVIAYLDASHGISTGYTVRVAPDPTI